MGNRLESLSTPVKSSRPGTVKIAWSAHPGPQSLALIRGEFEILYGGARGGGKTDAGQIWLIEPHYLQNPKYRFLVIRQNAKDLADWLDRARTMYRPLGAVVVGQEIRFPSGAIGRLGHLKDKNAFEHYLGHEYQKILIEELTLIPSEEYYLKLISSCRSTVEGLTPQVFCTTNPGNAGHIWVKNRFVKHGDTKPFQDPVTGRWRIFISAKVSDNPTLMKADPTYILWLQGLPPKLRKAWLDGDWDVFEGQFFDTWNENLHVFQPFNIPKEWPRFRMMDWGYSDHFACLWGAVGPYFLRSGQRLDNHVYIYREFYRNRLTDSEYAEAIAGMSRHVDGTVERIEYTVGDPISFWNKIPNDKMETRGAKPFFERWETFALNGISIVKGDNQRIPGWTRLREYLQPRKFGEEEVSWLHISTDCSNLVRTLPSLVHDDLRVEDVADGMEDHAPDALRLGLQSRTPQEYKKEKRYRTNFEAAEAQAKRQASEGRVDKWK